MKFNKQQEEVINHINGNISVIATAGSGKTTVLVHRIKNMIDNYGVIPSTILPITFSRKAKENIEDRLRGMGIYNVTVETFHSFALRIISSAYGVGRFKVWSAQWKKERVVQDICTNLRLCSVDDVPYNEIVSFIVTQKNNMKSPTDKLIYTGKLPFKKKDMAKIYSAYEDFKTRNSYIEFDDFLNMANDILRDNKELVKSYRSTCKYVLVDEFQDVSLSQATLLKKINTANTMIVGDPLQAIYSFRGGDSRFILNFDEDYKNVKVINLNTNYRCSKDIVLTANRLADSIPDSQHKNYIESIAFNGKNEKPELWHFYNDYDEADWVAKKILNMKKSGYKCGNIAVLARTNAQLQKIETALHEVNLSFDVVGGGLFTELPEIKLITSYLRLALHDNDNEAFSYLYNKPNRWLNKKFYEEVERNSVLRNTSLYNAMFTIDRRNWRFKNGIDEIFEVINYIQNKKYSSVADLVKYLRIRLDIDRFVTKGKQADDGCYTEQIDNLDSFENMCAKYSTIEQLLNCLEDMNDVSCNGDDDKVKLLNIHKAKGTEYPIVFIIGCNEGLLPHCRSNDIDDECRLFYVAITRAERELYMSYVDLYNGKFKPISPFIDNIAETIKTRQESRNNREY